MVEFICKTKQHNKFRATGSGNRSITVRRYQISGRAETCFTLMKKALGVAGLRCITAEPPSRGAFYTPADVAVAAAAAPVVVYLNYEETRDEDLLAVFRGSWSHVTICHFAQLD